ncbi:MAG: aminodeoxychorismate synthase component I [Oleiphilaceae bacterium]|nr:aminodeoxychorismate synthase component I [Oleiphilaceae bacterium]
MVQKNEQLSLPADTLTDFLLHLSRQRGFVQFTNRGGPEQRFSAWPARTWALPAEPEAFAACLKNIDAAHHKMARGAGAIAGVCFYEAGRHTQPGFVSRGAGSTGSLGYVGQYLWQLTVKDPGNDQPAILEFHPACPEADRAQVRALVMRTRCPDPDFRLVSEFKPDTSAGHYRQGVERILQLIHAGDCYQVNLSQKFTSRFTGQPYVAFLALTESIPVPHSAYLDAGDYQVLSISPEMFLKIESGEVTSKPIKGTRPRHSEPEEDRQLAESLRTNPKDRAENLMIVDLIRNDLSHFCTPFSVKVPELFRIESYRNVHQLVSTVTGRLRPGVSALQALISAFPGGSITGAPKRRSMEIIEELEAHDRGPYCGSLFWWDYHDRLESNIAIRTLMTESSGRIHCWAGCGIVADSSPAEEYEESITKVRRLMDTLEALG